MYSQTKLPLGILARLRTPQPNTYRQVYHQVWQDGRNICIQLTRERLSEKVHATIPKGIKEGFEKEWHERPSTYVCECKRKATKVGLTATVSGTVYWSYLILPFRIVACTFFPTTFLETAVKISTNNHQEKCHIIRRDAQWISTWTIYWHLDTQVTS